LATRVANESEGPKYAMGRCQAEALYIPPDTCKTLRAKIDYGLFLRRRYVDGESADREIHVVIIDYRPFNVAGSTFYSPGIEIRVSVTQRGGDDVIARNVVSSFDEKVQLLNHVRDVHLQALTDEILQTLLDEDP
jgi:hypothetical protein